MSAGVDDSRDGFATMHSSQFIIDSICDRSARRAMNDSRDQDMATLVANLEADLTLSATVGAKLLDEKRVLESRIKSLEADSARLAAEADRLNHDNLQLQRQLEETVSNLEQSDESNRALLVSLEEDRKTISRLSLDVTRLTTSSTQLQSITRKYEDTRQELEQERRRADASEARARKQRERLAEMDRRLGRATGDLEELRQEKVLRSRKSHDALAKVRARFSERSTTNVAFGAIGEHPDAAEMLQLIGSLVQENDLLRSESVELAEMLNKSREDKVEPREITIHEGPVLADESTCGRTYLSEHLLSPSSSHVMSDFDLRPHSPVDMSTSTAFTRSWGPSSDLSAVAEARVERAGSDTSSIRIPFGARPSRRSLSIDIGTRTARSRRGSGSMPASPIPTSPPSMPPSYAGSEVSEPIKRPRRHHRPLSLSLGTPLFPKVPEDDNENVAPVFARHLSYTPAESAKPSGLTLTSPPKRKRRDSSPRRPEAIDTAVQTSPRFWASSAPSPPASPARTMSSLPDSAKLDGFDLTDNITSHAKDARSEVVHQLVEYIARLLHRIQLADVLTQEKRLKKQNLSGDVRHVALANLKEIHTDVENMRVHFRRLERMANADTGSSSRRDLMILVKLFRELFSELVRMRGLINRLALDPALATSLRDLDQVDLPFDAKADVKATTSGGLLAPISKLISSALSSEPDKTRQNVKAAGVAGTGDRPTGKLTSSNAVSSATVNVEFAGTSGAAVRRVVNSAAPPLLPIQSKDALSSHENGAKTLRNKRSALPPRNDLSAIFAGKMAPASQPATTQQDWVVVPTVRTNAFGRLLASYTAYLPGMSTTSATSTANAVLDGPAQQQQHSSPFDPSAASRTTLLERQLRPRGLSDSSIRSTFVAHGKLDPVTRESEIETSAVVPITITTVDSSSSGEATSDSVGTAGRTHRSTTAPQASLATSLRGPGSLKRQQSIARLKSKPSFAKLSSSAVASSPTQACADIPPVPALPISLPVSDATTNEPGASTSATSVTASGSLLANMGSWAVSLAEEERRPRLDYESRAK